MMKDVMADGLAAGWLHTDASTLEKDEHLEADFVVIGTGAGGGIAAEQLTLAGHRVILVEEGPLRTTRQFKSDERVAYGELYQEAAARKTKDKAINILQGRCVGGGTTVNWTSSFETPDNTLKHWQQAHGVKGCSPEEMAPWFTRARERLNILAWEVPPNPNNAALQRGAEKLGWSFGVMNRNVTGCGNLGYCGMGCPIEAKQSMLVTTIAASLAGGARLLSRARAQKFEWKNGRITGLVCQSLDGEYGVKPTGKKVTIKAGQYVLSAGAIGSPALLMRSEAPDPNQLVGRRTFLHPVAVATGIMDEPVNGFFGAPQSIYTDQFMWWDGVTGKMGFKIEVPPLHPLLTSTVLGGHGSQHLGHMKQFANTQAMLCLGRDGFHEESRGGTVRLKGDGTPLLDYPLNGYIMEGLRKAYKDMIEVQFAAGVKEAMPMHRDVAQPYKSWAEAKSALDGLDMRPLQAKIFSAHVMGGCPLGEDPENSVVSSTGQHHQLENLTVLDGSVFPTSIGSNPQLSIYGMTLKNVTALMARV